MAVELRRHTFKAGKDDHFGLGLNEQGVLAAIEYGAGLREKYRSVSVATSPVVRAVGTGFIARAAYEGTDRDTLIALVRGYDSADHLAGHPYAPAVDSRLKYTDPSPITAYSNKVITLDEAVRECHMLLDDDKVPAHSTDLENDRRIARADVARYIAVFLEAAQASPDEKDLALRIGHEPCVSGVQYVAADSEYVADSMLNKEMVGVVQPLQGITLMNIEITPLLTALAGKQPYVIFENGSLHGAGVVGFPVRCLKKFVSQYKGL